MLDTEIILDWQQRGITARILGMRQEDNPLLRHKPKEHGRLLDEWRQKIDAWTFGWSIEDALGGTRPVSLTRYIDKL